MSYNCGLKTALNGEAFLFIKGLDISRMINHPYRIFDEDTDIRVIPLFGLLVFNASMLGMRRSIDYHGHI